MSGLLRRLTRRPATADENRSPTESSDPAATPATGGEPPLPGGDEQATQVLGETSDPATREWAIGPTGWSGPKAPETTAAAPGATVPIAGQFPERRPDQTQAERPHAGDLPAGVDPAELEHAPASARRGRLRRRLRYLRSVRELLLRDLGGLTYEIHRTASGAPQESHARLQQGKADRIAALDAEVRALETRLGEPHATTTLREAGIGGTCPDCGELHASDAHFCSRCGAPLDAKARAKREAATAPEESRPASALWAGLRGRKPSEPEPAPDKAAAVTGEWLGTGDQPTTFDRAVQPDTGDRPEPSSAVRDESASAAVRDEPTSAAVRDESASAAVPDESASPGDEPVQDAAAAGEERAEDGEPVTFVEGRRDQP